jgi:hypothetical protein
VYIYKGHRDAQDSRADSTRFARGPWAIQRPRAFQDIKKPTPRFPDLEFSSAE